MTLRPRRREPIELTLDANLLALAGELGVDVARAAEAGLREAVRKAWLDENAEAIQSFNEWVERNGLPLEKYRQF